MNMLRLTIYLVAVDTVCIFSGVASAADPYINLGPGDLLPPYAYVGVEIYDPATSTSYGPSPESGTNKWVLDTAAQGIIAYGLARDALDAAGWQGSVAVYDELGVGGTSPYDVSATYSVDFAGRGSAQRETVYDVRLLSRTGSLGDIFGVVGTAGMSGRVTSMDMREILTAGEPTASFQQTVPAGSGHRYSVPLSMLAFDHSGQRNANDPLPTFGPVPFTPATASHGGTSQTGSFVVDTGAQFSNISQSVGFSLGLDTDGDGDLTDETDTLLPISGASGTVYAPVLAVDRFLLQTAEGTDIVWNDALFAVFDIDPSISGLIGQDLLSGGWNDAYLAADGTEGYFQQMHFDFVDAINGNGTLLLDMNPEYDVLIPEPFSLSVLGLGGLALLGRRRRGATARR